MDPSETIDTVIGRNLRALREKSGLSQGDLGYPSGITYQQVQKYESGISRLSASRLAEFAKTMQCSVLDFFTGVPQVAAELERKPDLEAATKMRLSELVQAMAIELGVKLKKVGGRNG